MAPLVGLPLLCIGIVAFIALAVGIAKMLPRFQCGKWARRITSGGLFVAALPIFLWCLTTGSKALVILLAYGADEYAAGLWIVDKHGNLSDGRALSDFWMGVWMPLGVVTACLTLLPLVVFRLITDSAGNRAMERD